MTVWAAPLRPALKSSGGSGKRTPLHPFHRYKAIRGTSQTRSRGDSACVDVATTRTGGGRDNRTKGLPRGSPEGGIFDLQARRESETDHRRHVGMGEKVFGKPAQGKIETEAQSRSRFLSD